MGNSKIKQVQVGSSVYDVLTSQGQILELQDNGTTTAGTWLAKSDDVSAYVDGQMYLYKITVAGATTTTLKINSLAAKTIYRQSTTKLGTQFAVGNYLLLVYNTTNDCFRVINFYDTDSDHYCDSYCNTAAATAAKAVVHTSYALTSKSYLLVTFVNGNTSASKITLNVNSQGAKDLWINGKVSSSSNYSFGCGPFLVYYDGTKYMMRTDGVIPGPGEVVLTATRATICTTDTATLGDGLTKQNLYDLINAGVNVIIRLYNSSRTDYEDCTLSYFKPGSGAASSVMNFTTIHLGGGTTTGTVNANILYSLSTDAATSTTLRYIEKTV